jgi:hypothetical protein
MKRNVLYKLLLLPLAMLIATWSMSQTATSYNMPQSALAPDQNPDYMVSQAKYLMMADSINSWHGTSFQETYKAIDWVADRQAARAQRRAFRHEVRMARARYGYGYYNDYDYNYPVYRRNYYGSYYPVYSRNYGYNYDPYYQYRPSRNYWSLVGVAATAATIGYLIAK